MAYQLEALAGDVRAFPVPGTAVRISEAEKRTLADLHRAAAR